MISSVSEEADRELTDAAIYYAREASLAIAAAFVAEFERALDLLCSHPYLAASMDQESTPLSFTSLPNQHCLLCQWR